MKIARLDEISDISFDASPADRQNMLDVIDSAARLAFDLVTKDFTASIGMPNFSGRSLGLAATSAMQVVNSLLSAVGTRCNRAAPPEEIEQKMTVKGTSVYRCYHDPAHEWDLHWNPLP